MTQPAYTRDNVTLYQGDCLDVLAELPDASVDAVVTDPPYGIRFMGQAWDGLDIQRGIETRRSQAAMPVDGKAGRNGGYRSAAAEAGRYDLSLTANEAFQEWSEQWARECLRVLRPGGHLLAFGGTRTWHRLMCGIEDAGFEIRDTIADLTGRDAAALLWLYGSGFPKSVDVSKAIDKAAGAERTVVVEGTPVRRMIPGADQNRTGSWIKDNGREYVPTVTEPATDEARRWEGWGTALKPAHEPIVVARKPLAGNVAANVLAHRTGALNVDACRIATTDDLNGGAYTQGRGGRAMAPGGEARNVADLGEYVQPSGRWPTNAVLGPDAAAELDEQSGECRSAGNYKKGSRPQGSKEGAASIPIDGVTSATYADSGGASRFFPVFRYEAKADTDERVTVDGITHPTVKPLALMRWLVRLVTPPGGTVLDLFAGTGTTLEAAVCEGMHAIGIERDYAPLCIARLNRRLDPVAYVRATASDDQPPSLFDGEAAS